ncbi:UNVERIFIED_CONTAM: hypothetical protein Sangu_3240100 [Sesamum angustifolium]|uniref:Uncharacterized protein n=1 Tax=Sesamum angustifolium TaxID=2727405 RepID=A0AAW2JG26_9LAMI
MSQNPFNAILEANKFDGTNYSNWLRNLGIVLDFENQTYVLDKSLPQILREGFLSRPHLMFENFTQWHEYNWKVRSIVLSLMSNEIQKQYERYADVWSIMHRMKERYAVPDRHIRYAVMKAFFGVRMIEGSSEGEHGVMMLSLMEKLKDLQADFDKEKTYFDVILQSLPPSYDQLIINYNMNRLEKSLHALINMLVQYEATIEKSAPLVLMGESSSSKRRARLPDARRGRRMRRLLLLLAL